MDLKPLTSRAGIMGVVRGVREIGHSSSEIRNQPIKVRRNDI